MMMKWSSPILFFVIARTQCVGRYFSAAQRVQQLCSASVVGLGVQAAIASRIGLQAAVTIVGGRQML